MGCLEEISYRMKIIEKHHFFRLQRNLKERGIIERLDPIKFAPF